jgi:hypothetical protein
MGPPLRTEIPKISPRRVRKTWGFTPAAAQLNAAVAHTVFGHGDCDGCTSAWATTSRRCVFSACRVPSWFASYVLDVDGFALVREAGVILRQNLSVHSLLRCFGCAGFFTPLQKVLKQLLGLLVSSRLARR